MQAILALTEMVTIHDSGMLHDFFYLMPNLNRYTVQAAVAPQVAKVIQGKGASILAFQVITEIGQKQNLPEALR